MTSIRIYVHGGVSGSPQAGRADLGSAVAAGTPAVDAIDAAEAATRVLEDDPSLNAGTGAVLNRDGGLELDAGICDGFSGRYGGVAAVAVRNPIVLARRVMEQTPHALMVGVGAARLGADLEPASPTAEQRARWERASAAGKLTDDSFGRPEFVDTVGTVALDESGRLVACSSTGGVFGKLPGRVGDAAILGAGLFASRTVAVVGTGVGELFLRSLACYRVAALVGSGVHPQEACRRIIELVGAQDPRPIGLLALDADARVGSAFRGASLQVEGPDGPAESARLG